MATVNRQIVLAARPEGLPKPLVRVTKERRNITVTAGNGEFDTLETRHHLRVRGWAGRSLVLVRLLGRQHWASDRQRQPHHQNGSYLPHRTSPHQIDQGGSWPHWSSSGRTPTVCQAGRPTRVSVPRMVVSR